VWPEDLQNSRTVTEAFQNETWLQAVRDGGGLSWHNIREFLQFVAQRFD
jgi:hypothetical protein